MRTRTLAHTQAIACKHIQTTNACLYRHNLFNALPPVVVKLCKMLSHFGIWLSRMGDLDSKLMGVGGGIKVIVIINRKHGKNVMKNKLSVFKCLLLLQGNNNNKSIWSPIYIQIYEHHYVKQKKKKLSRLCAVEHANFG